MVQPIGRRAAILASLSVTAPAFALSPDGMFEPPQTALARAIVGDTETAVKQDKEAAKARAAKNVAAREAKEERTAAAKAAREADKAARAAKMNAK